MFIDLQSSLRVSILRHYLGWSSCNFKCVTLGRYSLSVSVMAIQRNLLEWQIEQVPEEIVHKNLNMYWLFLETASWFTMAIAVHFL